MDLTKIGINTRIWVDSVLDKDYWRAPGNAALTLQVPYAMELDKITNISKIQNTA